MKKFFSLLLVFALFITLLTPCASAAGSTELRLSDSFFSPSDTNRLYIYVGVSGRGVSCTVTIYDSYGYPVAVLTKDNLTANTYTFIWDGRAAENNPAGYAAGNFVPSGSYTVTASVSLSEPVSAGFTVGSSVAATQYGNDEHGIPNYTGAADVDYMAELILDEIGVSGKSNYQLIRDIYTWVQAHGYRANSTYYIDPDDSKNTHYFDLESMTAEINAAKARYDALHDAGLISYDVDNNLHVRNARQMMVYRIGTCLEFSSLFQVLLCHVGIECWTGGSSFINSDGSVMVHKWNRIRINGVYYWSDVRIDNAEYERSGRNTLHYDYFLDPDTDHWAKRHIWDSADFPIGDTLTPAMDPDNVEIIVPSQPPQSDPGVSSSGYVPSYRFPDFDKLYVSDGLKKQAVVSTAKVLINGREYSFEAYNIDDCNYFRLRDLAYALNGTESQFSVDWNGELNLISLVAGVPYTVVGGELSRTGIKTAAAIPTPSGILWSGYNVSLSGYLIGENNYFRLRDLGELFFFSIGWDGDNGIITIDTTK